MDNFSSAAQSYATVGMGFVSELDWMAIGAMILLIARLCKDVPDAVAAIKRLFTKENTPNDKSE